MKKPTVFQTIVAILIVLVSTWTAAIATMPSQSSFTSSTDKPQSQTLVAFGE